MQAGWLAPEAGSALAKGSSLVVELLPLLLSNPLFNHLDCQICCTWRDKPSDALEFIHFVPLINASMNLGPGAQCAVTMPPGPCIAPLVLFVEVIRVEAGRHQLTSSGCLCSTTTGTPEALKHQGRLWLQTSLVFSNTSIFTSYGP